MAGPEAGDAVASAGPGPVVIEKSGTLDSKEGRDPHILNAAAEALEGFTTRKPVEESANHSDDEEALEWHEVIELQAFSERKAWIEEKIKFLESLPPVEVFVGLDAVRNSAEEVPGLPTRAQLKEWLEEHDRIEKETEIFDSGELKKLKKFTKAATQRNLSPADTDLIELTLTTIYTLDKLFHLLRDRSDNLELLGIRLTWEERRIGSWKELRQLNDDLRGFLDTRARWSPSTYENAVEDDLPAPAVLSPRPRRGSIASITSTISEADSAMSNLPGLSRSSRFKLADALTRDAAQLASRVSALRHAKIAGAGKSLDKLIDHSRRSVPDELLDEQDRLEDKGINEMEDVGKFMMNVVMQWKKADELYVETLKDKSALQTLLEEIEVASLHQPTGRQDASFLSRSTGLMKRLTMRGSASVLGSLFPNPTHPLYPDQAEANEVISQTLSSELSSALEVGRKVEACAKEYHASAEAVKRVETACKAASDISSTLASLIGRLEKGVPTEQGLSSSPDLSSELCLHDGQHDSFLLAFPSIILDMQKTMDDASALLPSARAALQHLDRQGICKEFKSASTAQIEALQSQCDATVRIHADVEARIAALKEVRGLWSVMGKLFGELDVIRRNIPDAIEKRMWRQRVQYDGAPPTPESPSTDISPSIASAAAVFVELDHWQDHLNTDVLAPLGQMSPLVGPALQAHLTECSDYLDSLLHGTVVLARFWEAVLAQATNMGAVRDEAHSLQIQLETLKVRVDQGIQDVISGTISGDSLLLIEGGLTNDVKHSQEAVNAFLQDLPHRVPFVGRLEGVELLPSKRMSAPIGFSLDILRQASGLYLPFDPVALDQGVRTDANSYSMMLSGVLKSLEQKANHFQLVKLTGTIDTALATVTDGILRTARSVTAAQAAITEVPDDTSLLDHLAILAQESQRISDSDVISVAQSLSAARELHRRLKSWSDDPGTGVLESLISPRQRNLEDVEAQYSALNDSIASLQQNIGHAQEAERVRIAEDIRLREEQKRLEAEEHARLERERAEAEERARTEQERLLKEKAEAEEHAKAEAERLRQEAEVERLRQEAEAEAERLRLEEEERLRSEEEERLRLEEEEKARLKAERLRREEEIERERLAELERAKAEAERLAQEEVERGRLAAEEAEKATRLAAAEVIEAARLSEESAAAEREGARAELAANQTQSGDAEVPWLHETGSPERPRGAILESVEESEEDTTRGRISGSKLAEDVFGLLPAPIIRTASKEYSELRARVVQLRKRLALIRIDDSARPSRTGLSLPTDEMRKQMQQDLAAVSNAAGSLPAAVPDDPVVDTDLRSLRNDLKTSLEIMRKVDQLADISDTVATCDAALSDLLEHIDSYPAQPIGPLSSSHVVDLSQAPEEQLTARLVFTTAAMEKLKIDCSALLDDPRVASERNRVLQTWEELEAMALDRVNGQRSRPPSAISDHSSKSSTTSAPKHRSKKSGGYSKLSVGSAGGFLAPPVPISRRSTSGVSTASQARSASRASIASSSRSVSGPANPSSSLYGSTFASRQRTASITSNAVSTVTPAKRAPVGRPRAHTGAREPNTPRERRESTASPAFSETSSLSVSRPRVNSSLSSTSRSSWSRAPTGRQSLSSLPMSPPQAKVPLPERKPYIPNPKNKLDVAVGDVLNKLPINIKVEVVADTWKDQSGKYWIGDDEPKLCFCRILRSQTVMVRVGGGWSELSKFIKDHFADAFRILPESPQWEKLGSREEKWISSSTLSQAADGMALFQPPMTPEPRVSYIPSFALQTPSGASPKSMRSTSPSSGSPLTALQFLRRVDRDSPSLRPETPSRSTRSTHSTMSAVHHTPASARHQPVWRP